MKSSKDGEKLASYLSEPFYYISTPSSTGKAKKRKSAPTAALLEEVFVAHTHPEIAAGAYDSLKDDYNSLLKENETLKCEVDTLKAQQPVHQTQTVKPPSTPRLTQDLKRQSERAVWWRSKYSECKKAHNSHLAAHKNCGDLVKKVQQLQSILTSQRHYYKKKLKGADDLADASVCHDECVQKEEDLKDQISFLEDELLKLKSETEMQTDAVVTKDGKVYNSAVRRSIYNALSHQCPVEHASAIVGYTAEQFLGRPLKSLPCAATVSRMARELGVLSDIQSADALLHSPSSGIAWDATDLHGRHVNEIHVVTGGSDEQPHKYHCLSIGQLPGGTTNDYTAHIATALDDTAQAYAKWSGQETGEVISTMKSNITCTISDRVAVNHCVVEKMKDFVNTDLVELKCNLHPLDSIALKAREVLKKTGVTGSVLGRQAAAVNLVHGMSKMRWKMGTGDPLSFITFCEDQNIPLGSFPRYVGNWLHILFHLAGIYFHHQAKMVLFLTKFCP